MKSPDSTLGQTSLLRSLPLRTSPSSLASVPTLKPIARPTTCFVPTHYLEKTKSRPQITFEPQDINRSTMSSVVTSQAPISPADLISHNAAEKETALSKAQQPNDRWLLLPESAPPSPGLDDPGLDDPALCFSLSTLGRARDDLTDHQVETRFRRIKSPSEVSPSNLAVAKHSGPARNNDREEKRTREFIHKRFQVIGSQKRWVCGFPITQPKTSIGWIALNGFAPAPCRPSALSSQGHVAPRLLRPQNSCCPKPDQPPNNSVPSSH